MSNKSRKKKVGICLSVTATCVVVTGLWAVLVTPEAALAAPPEGKGKGGAGGGDAGNTPVCIDFDIDGGIQSDDGTPYCDDKQLKVEAIMTQDGHVNLQPNTGRGDGRTLYVDVDLNPDDDPGVDYTVKGWRLLVGGWRDDFDMRAMTIEESRNDVNLMINAEAPSNSENIVNWQLNFWPDRTRHGIDYSDSTYITVTRISPDKWTIEVDDTDRAVLVMQKQVKNKSEFSRLEETVRVPSFTATVTLTP